MRGAWTILAALVGVLSLPAHARACSPDCPPSVLPNGATKGVPSNTRIWVFDGWLASAIAQGSSRAQCAVDQGPHLETNDGRPVPTTMTHVGRDVMFTPDVALSVGATYVFRLGCDDVQEVTFEVTAPADTVPPPTPSFTVGAYVDEEDDCFHDRYRKVDASGGAPLYVVDVGASMTGDGLKLEGPVAGLSLSANLSQIGDAGCTKHWGLELTSEPVRIAAVDLAGNRSPWTEPTVISLAPDPPAPSSLSQLVQACSCRTGPRPTALWLLIPLLVLRRRRR